MSTSVDVLAEMEQAHATLKRFACASEMTVDHVQADAMLEARDAVAELIEAASPIDQEVPRMTREQHARFLSALARVKGGAA